MRIILGAALLCAGWVLCAMGATINRTARFDAVSNHVALTVSASWRHRVNRTFEAIERQGFVGLRGNGGLLRFQKR
jgi:hypothetical protein